MRRALTCLVTVLLPVTFVLAMPADARSVRVRMDQPTVVSAHKARLEGRVRGWDSVEIQRFARASERWVRVKAVRADREGDFATTVRVTRRWQRYRAVAGPGRSLARRVPGAAPPGTTEPVPADACGPQPLKDDGRTRWSCTLAQDFDGTELDRSVWRPQVGFNAGSDAGRPCYLDDPSVISVHGGALHLSARSVITPVPCPSMSAQPTAHVAGGVSTYRLFSQQYGRFEARIKNTATTVPGLHEAFWLWPDDRYSTTLWPAAGEIDIVETYSVHPDLAIPFLHYTWYDNGGPIPGLNTAWSCTAHRGEFNTYTLEWTRTRLEIFVNGTSCLVNTSGDPAFHKPYIVALTQALGATGNEYDAARTALPAETTVDYVRVWQ